MKKRVLFITHEDLNKTAVARAMLLDVAESLKHDCDCTILSASGTEGLYKTHNLQWMHFKRTSHGKASLGDFWLLIAFLFRNRVEISQFDVFYIRSYPSMLLFSIIAKIYSIPTIFDTRGLFFHELIDSGKIKYKKIIHLLIPVERLMLKSSKAVVCVSESQMHYYLPLEPNKEKYHIIYNAAPVSRATPNQTDASGLTVAYVGSMGRWHLPEKINKIVDHLRQQRPDLIFHCITPNLQEAKSIFTNHPNTLIYSYDYRYNPKRFDFAFCLIQETLAKKVCFPVKLCEYLASHTPVVFSNNVDVCNKLNNRYEFGFPIDIDKSPLEIASSILDNLQFIVGRTVTLPEELQFETLIENVAAVIKSVRS